MCEPRSGPYTVDRMGAVLVVDRGEHPEPGVSTAPVVERLDVLEHRGPGFGLGGPGAAVDEVLLQARVEALHRGVVEAVSAGSVGHLDPDEAATTGEHQRRVLRRGCPSGGRQHVHRRSACWCRAGARSSNKEM